MGECDIFINRPVIRAKNQSFSPYVNDVYATRELLLACAKLHVNEHITCTNIVSRCNNIPRLEIREYISVIFSKISCANLGSTFTAIYCLKGTSKLPVFPVRVPAHKALGALRKKRRQEASTISLIVKIKT